MGFERGKTDSPSEAGSVLPRALRKALPKFNVSSGLETGERSRVDANVPLDEVLALAPSLTPQAQS